MRTCSDLTVICFARKDGTLKDLDEPIPQAHLFEHFANHIGDNFLDENGQEDFSFWNFQLIDKSPDEERLEERENFWIYKLGTMTHMGGLNVQEVPVGSKKRKKQTENRRTGVEEQALPSKTRGRGRGRGRSKSQVPAVHDSQGGSTKPTRGEGTVPRGRGKATRGRGRGARGRGKSPL